MVPKKYREQRLTSQRRYAPFLAEEEWEVEIDDDDELCETDEYDHESRLKRVITRAAFRGLEAFLLSLGDDLKPPRRR